MKQTNLKESVDIIEKNIKKHRGNFTLSDASGTTGLSIEEARLALDQVMSKYVCRLQMTGSGDLIYNFGPSLKLKGALSLMDYISGFFKFLYKVFTVLFKIWITVTLVVYFVIFVLILIALLIALSAGNKNNSKKSNINLGFIFRIFGSIFIWKTHTGSYSYASDRDGYKYKQYNSNKPIIPLNEAVNKKNLIASVYDFVFGPPRVKVDPLSNEKEAASYIRKNNGLLTISELIALAGWTMGQAEEKIADYTSRFQGDAEISDNKVMYCRFDRLVRSSSDYQGGEIVYYWDEYEPPFKITGNSFGKNALIIIMNLFNLCMALAVLFNRDLQDFIFNLIRQFYIPMDFILIGLGIVPVVFSILFFLVPLLRIPYVTFMENIRKYANKRRRVVKVVYNLGGGDLKFNEVKNKIENAPETKLTEKEIQSIMDKLRLELNGQKDADLSGNIIYSFNRIKDELTEVKRLKNVIKMDKNLGPAAIEI